MAWISKHERASIVALVTACKARGLKPTIVRVDPKMTSETTSHHIRLERIPVYAFLLAFSFVSFELTFFRILSGFRVGVSLLSSFVFAAAVLGLGVGGVYSLLENRKKDGLRRALFFAPVSIPLLVLISLLILILKGYYHSFTSQDNMLLSVMSTMYLLLPFIILAFMVFGFAVGTLLLSAARDSKILLYTWASDLFGSACGGLLPVILIFYLDPLQILLIPVFSSSLITLLFFLEKPRPEYKHYLRNFLFALVPLLFIYVSLWDPINYHYPSSPKTGFVSGLKSFIMNEPHFDYAAWSPYHKVNYVASPDVITLFYDNIQHTKIVKPSYTFDLDAIYANIRNKSHVLIIGAGGGRDINSFVKMHDPKSITAVELEPLALKLARSFPKYASYLYDPRTTYLIGEGRHFLNKTPEVYTAIVFPSTDSFYAIVPQSLVKQENYLYTVEAFRDICNHLTKDGTLVVSLWSSLQHYLSDMVGADSTFKTVALRLYRNMSEVVPRKENIVIADSGYRTPYRNSRIVMLYAKSGIDRETIQRSFRTSDTILTDDPNFIDAAEKIIPTTDDRPFFYIRDKHLPLIIKMSIGYLLVITCAALGPVLTKAISQTRLGVSRKYFTLASYFFCTGAGFMLIINVLVYKFLISFGVPYLSSTVVIVTMLTGAGCGSLIVANMKVLRPRVILLSFCLLILSLLGLPYYINLLNMFLPRLGLVHRTLLATALVFPFAVFTGVPFPVGLSWLREINPQGVVIAYSIDVLGGITGIILSLVIPIWFGYSAVFSLIALVYILLFFLWFAGMSGTKQEHERRQQK